MFYAFCVVLVLLSGVLRHVTLDSFRRRDLLDITLTNENK